MLLALLAGAGYYAYTWTRMLADDSFAWFEKNGGLTRKNGEVTQEDSTANMIFSFADIIAYITTFMTLRPGDVICTGTPVKKVKSDPPIWLKPGDVIEVECPEIGILRNTVAAEA